ncbi:MAG: DUF424 family protein [Candidatus Verstraetearchaeota archaeon]|jgi:hypothetical protein|nr:DUF424 family protein [Candidatus Verstraetearchaeota archaeon]
MEEVYVRVRKTENDILITVCDCDLLGKKIVNGKLVLNISKEFYEGEKMSKEATLDILKKATIALFVGKTAVKYGIEAGLVHKDAIIEIGGVPYAQFVMII